jgi:hypothetical protein
MGFPPPARLMSNHQTIIFISFYDTNANLLLEASGARVCAGHQDNTASVTRFDLLQGRSNTGQ